MPAKRIPQSSLANEVDLSAEQDHGLISHFDQVEQAALGPRFEGDR
jgi:hypothetical protein